MKRGFTLIELMGVIVLLSAILVIVMPNIINSIKKGNNEKDSYTASMIYEATKLYIGHSNEYTDLKGTTYCISINQLVDEGLLESPIEYNSIKNFEETMSVKATYNNKWNYSIVKNTECTSSFICDRTTLDNKTTGLVPEGDYRSGDEYICKLNNNIIHHFFVLSTNGNKVSLIGSGKLAANGELTNNNTDSIWYNGSINTNGPINAYNYILDNTANWTNIYSIKNFTYIDTNSDGCGYKGIFTREDGGNYITSIIDNSNNVSIPFTNLKARLPLLSEITSVGCTPTTNSCPEWLGTGFYLNNTLNDSISNVYYVANRAIASSAPNSNNGVVPVIELHKSDLE